MKINTQLNQFKESDTRERVFAPDTLENDEALIRKCTTEAEINFQSDSLLKEHKELKEKKEAPDNVY